jgi:hypothetical protein
MNDIAQLKSLDKCGMTGSISSRYPMILENLKAKLVIRKALEQSW